jgi:hypothetical protein
VKVDPPDSVGHRLWVARGEQTGRVLAPEQSCHQIFDICPNSGV